MALLDSNNIQDRPNLEMMVHLEGPIVDSLYDTALISWFRPMHPPLPLLDCRYRPPEGGYKFGMDNEYATTRNLDGSKGAELFKKLEQAGGKSDGDGHEGMTKQVTPLEPLHAGVPFISGSYQTITEHLSKSSSFFFHFCGLTPHRCRRSARYSCQHPV